MRSSRGTASVCVAIVAAGAFIAGHTASGCAGEARRAANSRARILPSGPLAVETVYFADPKQAPVALVRGPHAAPAVLRGPGAAAPPAVPGAPPQRVEFVSFGTGFADRVKVIRGGTLGPASLASLGGQSPAAPRTGLGRIGVDRPAQSPVTVVRGSAIRELFAVDLFGPANGGELDRIAFAVEGVESRHGADPGMWRPSWTAAQGPMQVTASAALDVGGGDRFDLYQNRLLGRAYLAQMYQRYGNWQDALAAYNWGPGNVDLWIAAGHNTDFLPTGVIYYVARVLRDSLVAGLRH